MLPLYVQKGSGATRTKVVVFRGSELAARLGLVASWRLGYLAEAGAGAGLQAEFGCLASLESS